MMIYVGLTEAMDGDGKGKRAVVKKGRGSDVLRGRTYQCFSFFFFSYSN